jgi:isopentenyl-diphosphate delta-isomerase
MSNNKNIIITLVDAEDSITGFEEKMEVHRKGLLHRAFSILIFNQEGKMLIHQRAFEKYHSPGLWTNACCGHPNKGENILDAAHRRLGEEMGFDCELNFKFKFHYRAEFDNGLIENELDHVFFGDFNEKFAVNPMEVADWKWILIDDLKEDIIKQPNNYTVWFKEILKRLRIGNK